MVFGFFRHLFYAFLSPVLWSFFPSITVPHLLCFSWLPATHLSLILHSLSFSTPILAHLKFWATFNQAYWHRLVVDDFFFAVITHVPTCMHTQICWGWWLMNKASLTASVPIRTAQETAFGLLATAWHWRQILLVCLLCSGRNVKSCGYTILNMDNYHKQCLWAADRQL